MATVRLGEAIFESTVVEFLSSVLVNADAGVLLCVCCLIFPFSNVYILHMMRVSLFLVVMVVLVSVLVMMMVVIVMFENLDHFLCSCHNL